MAVRSSTPNAAAIRLALAGAPRLLDGGRGKALAPRDAALLAYLALEGTASRANVIAMLWPDADAETARNALRQRIFQLNRRAGCELVAGSELLTLAAGVVVDDDEAAPSDAELLQGADHSEWPLFEQWLAQRRAVLRREHRDALAAHADAAERDGRLPEALHDAERLVELDAVQEDAHRRLMRLHYLSGDRAAAIAAFERCERTLKDELGVKPGGETLALLDLIERAAQAPPAPRRGTLPPAVQRPPRLVGRAAELSALRLAAAAGRAAWLVGEAGMGKSRLLAEWAAERGAAVVVQARPDDTASPYATLARLWRALLGARPPPDAALQKSLAALLPETGIEPVPAARAPAQLRATTAQLVAAAADAATLIVDDLHFADEASVAVLGAVLEPRGELAVAYAMRPGEGTAAARALGETLVGARAADRVPLSPLTVDGLRELVESLALPELDAATLAPLLARHSGGNPMFALETLKQMVLEGATAALPRPLHVGELIEKRLRALSPQAMALLRVAAVAGNDFTLPLAEHIVGASVLDLADAWDELERAQVFRDGLFAHDLVHEAALRLVPQAVARTLHGRIAGWLETQRAAVERVAHHWRAAHDAERAVPALRAAAASALALFQRPAALVHLEQAVEFLLQLGRDREAFEVQLEVVSLLQGQDSGARHEAAVARLQTIAATPGEALRAGIALAILRHIQGRDDDAVAAIDACAAHVAGASARERCEAVNVRGVALRALGRIDEAIAAHREAIATARGAEAREELPGCLNNLALALLEAGDAVQAAQAFEESARLQGDVMTRARVLNNLGVAREECGQPQVALDARRDALALLRGQDGAEFARANVLISMAANARSLQRYGAALALLDEADAVGLPPTYWRASNLYCQCAALWIDLGAFDRAEAAIARAVQTPAQGGGGVDALLVEAALRQARGAAARELLDRCDTLLRDRADRRTIRMARLRRALEGPPEERRDLAAREIEIEQRHGNRAAQIAFDVALALALLDLGDAAAARAAAERGVATMREAYPLLVKPIEVGYVCWRTLRATGDPAAPPLIRQLATDLRTIAGSEVPPEFRHGFLSAVRLHRRILADAAEDTRATR